MLKQIIALAIVSIAFQSALADETDDAGLAQQLANPVAAVYASVPTLGSEIIAEAHDHSIIVLLRDRAVFSSLWNFSPVPDQGDIKIQVTDQVC